MENYKVSAIMISKNKNGFLSMVYEATFRCGMNISLANSFPDLLRLIQSGNFQILIIDSETSFYDDNIFDLFSPSAYHVPHILLAYNTNKPDLQFNNSQIILAEYKEIPFILSKLADINIVKQLPIAQNFQLSDEKQKEMRKYLLEIGLCTKYRGFDYLLEIAKIMIAHNNAKSLNRNIYPVVASKYFTTCSAVERNIRHALTACWQTSNKMKTAFADYYKDSKAPSNRFFLCTLKQLLKDRLNIV